MKKKIRLLFVIESLQVGGAEKSLITLLGNLNYSEVDVELLLFSRGGLFEKSVPPQVKILTGQYPKVSLWQRILYKAGKWVKYKNLHEAQLFWKIIGQKVKFLPGEYDVAIAYNQQFSTYFVSSRVKAVRKFSWMNTLYNNAKYSPQFDWPYFKKFDALVAVSPEALNHLDTAFTSEKFPLKTVIIKDLVESQVIAEKAQEELPFKFSPEYTNLVTVCRLDRSKGLYLAVDAADILKNKGVDFRWYILGEGAERSGLEAAIKSKGLDDHVLLLGATSNPYPYMKACDIYVQTSLVEGLGLTVIEAVVLQKPVVCTNFDTAVSIIAKGDIITEKTPQSIAEGICTFIENPDTWVREKSEFDHIKKDRQKSLEKFKSLLS